MFLLSILLIAPGGAAQAHDELISTDPEAGASVVEPEQLTLTYSAHIAEIGAMVEITGPEGESVGGLPEVVGPDVIVDLRADAPLAAGRYDVIWRVTSSDGHPISGEFHFEVEVTAEPTPSDPPTEPAETDAAGTEEDSTDAAGTPGQDPTSDSTEDTSTQTGDGGDTPGTTDDSGSSPEPTELATGPEDASDDDAADSEEGQDAPGMPWWTWVVILAGVAVLGGLLARTWSRGRE